MQKESFSALHLSFGRAVSALYDQLPLISEPGRFYTKTEAGSWFWSDLARSSLKQRVRSDPNRSFVKPINAEKVLLYPYIIYIF